MKQALLVIPVDAPGGAEKVAALLAQALADSGDWRVEFRVMASAARKFYGLTFKGNIDVKYGSGSGRAGSEFRLLGIMRKRSFDLVYSSHMRINTFLALARRVGLLRCARLVTRESTILSDRYHGLRMLPYRLGYCCYGAQDQLVMQSSYMAQELSRLLPESARDKITVLENPVAVQEIKQLAASGESIALAAKLQFVWCGRLVAVKRPVKAIQFLKMLRERGVDAQLVMIGSGPLEGEVMSQIDELGLHGHVHCTGHLDNPYSQFAAADCGLVTSASEGFPNVLLEMQACGVGTVLATPCTEGLEAIPGVVVAKGFSIEDMLEAFDSRDAVATLPQRIEDALLQRSPDDFAAAVVGERSVQPLGADVTAPLLSICIASYNRSVSVCALVNHLLEQQGDFEVRVHIDGATDDTAQKLHDIADKRLHITISRNRGRALALYRAITSSRGRYVMIFDDDDELYATGLKKILRDCRERLADTTCGFIYHMEQAPGVRLGSAFAHTLSNLLKLRADEGVSGDKKEVVRGELMRACAHLFNSGHRRVPTSLLWSEIARDYDIQCRDESVGAKAYDATGMSANITRLKKENPWPIARLHFSRCRGFPRGRYQSLPFLLRSAVTFAYYLSLSGLVMVLPGKRIMDHD